MSKHGDKASVRKLRITLHNLDINISFGAEIKYIFFFIPKPLQHLTYISRFGGLKYI